MEKEKVPRLGNMLTRKKRSKKRKRINSGRKEEQQKVIVKYSEREKTLRIDALGAYRLNTYRRNDFLYYIVANSKTRTSEPKKRNLKSSENKKRKYNKVIEALEKRKRECRVNSNFWFIPNGYMKETCIRNESDYPFET